MTATLVYYVWTDRYDNQRSASYACSAADPDEALWKFTRFMEARDNVLLWRVDHIRTYVVGDK